jgi:glutathione synthase/RimK-type ligase-like ATP-grasp enzyme
MFDKPLVQRLEPAPEELVNLVAQHNATTSTAVEPRTAIPAADLLADVHAAVEELPQVIRNHLEPRLLGIFFMRGIGSSAITTLVAYANEDLLGAVVVLDAEVFSQHKANEWATWRENTAFSPTADIHLKVRIAHDNADDRKAALQYVLLHEFGHVMASASEAMPNWWEKDVRTKQVGPNSFLSLGWQHASDGAMLPIAGQDFPLRAAISLYATPRLTGDQIPSIYQDLDKTEFPTLYAASDPHEDFAESFATYVHATLLGKPHELHIYREDQPIASYKSFWGTPRSRAKAAFFESFLSGPPNAFPRRQQHAEAAKLCSAIIEYSALAFLGLAPFLRLSVDSGDLRHVAQELVAQTADDEDNAVLWMNLSTAFFAVHQSPLGLAMQQQALLLRQQYHLPAAVQPAFCHVLMLTAPGDLAENMPLDCLLEYSGVDLTSYYSTLEAPLPPELPAHDVLLVAMSDTEKNRPLLKMLESLLADWENPVINRPQYIPRVERNTASVLLQDAPGLLMPLTHQVTREYLESVACGALVLTETYADCPFPVILRPVGSHAGRNLEKIDDAAAIAEYLAAVPDSAFYLSRFVDYSGADGLFRKYRVALIAGQAFACHMGVSSHWMIHYVNAGMYVDSAKRAEEAEFMANFADFANRHQAALDAIYQRCGLDYVCIDCAESPEGELLIFEVDHVMVVHAMDPEDLFPYKQEHMRKVRNAFEDFLISQMAPQH